LDLLQALRRAWVGLFLVALGVGLGVYAVSLSLPKRYVSQTLVFLDVAPLSLGLPELVPALGEDKGGQASSSREEALLGALVHALELTLPGLVASTGERLGSFARVDWDRERRVLALEALAPTPEEARERAERLKQEALGFLRAQVREAYREVLAAERLRAEEEASFWQKAQDRLSTSSSPVSPGVLAMVAYLETLAEVRQSWLQALLEVDGALDRLLVAQVLVPPTLPERPVAPRPLHYGVLAAMSVLLFGVLGVFLRELLRSA